MISVTLKIVWAIIIQWKLYPILIQNNFLVLTLLFWAVPILVSWVDSNHWFWKQLHCFHNVLKSLKNGAFSACQNHHDFIMPVFCSALHLHSTDTFWFRMFVSFIQIYAYYMCFAKTKLKFSQFGPIIFAIFILDQVIVTVCGVFVKWDFSFRKQDHFKF